MLEKGTACTTLESHPACIQQTDRDRNSSAMRIRFALTLSSNAALRCNTQNETGGQFEGNDGIRIGCIIG